MAAPEQETPRGNDRRKFIKAFGLGVGINIAGGVIFSALDPSLRQHRDFCYSNIFKKLLARRGRITK